MSATPATRKPTTLAGLATAIQSEHDAATTAARTAIEHAIRCGELLAEAKAKIQHGAWAGWLAEHFAGSARTASGYMRLAANRQRVADLGSVREALAELAAPREDADRSDAAKCPRAAHWGLEHVPPMTAPERAGLRESIREHGCLVPVELDEDGQALDGRERLAVCAELGIDPPTITRRGLSDEEKAGHALALNVLRGDYSEPPDHLANAREFVAIADSDDPKREASRRAANHLARAEGFIDAGDEAMARLRSLRPDPGDDSIVLRGPHGAIFRTTGLELPDDLTFEQWEQVGKFIAAIDPDGPSS